MPIEEVNLDDFNRDTQARADLKKYADERGLRYFEHKWQSTNDAGITTFYTDGYLLTGIKTEQEKNEEYAIAWERWTPVGRMWSYYPCTISLHTDNKSGFITSPICGESGKYVARHVYPSDGKTIAQLVDGIRKGMMEYYDFKKQLDTHEEKLKADGTYTANIKGHIEEDGVYLVTMANERINPKEKMCYFYEFEVSKKSDQTFVCKFNILHNEARDVFWMYNFPTFAGTPIGKKFKLVTNGKVVNNFQSCLGLIDQFLNIQSILTAAWEQIQEVKKCPC